MNSQAKNLHRRKVLRNKPKKLIPEEGKQVKFKMKTFVKTQIIIAFALIAVAFAPNVYAANLDITCNPDDGSTSCVVLPSNTAALFDPADVPNEGEYPLSDMKPG